MPRLRTLLSTALATAALLSAMPAAANSTHCPPGLAKKAVPCVPPGQAKKLWQRGERVEGGYVLIPRDEWERLALRDYGDESTYLQADDQILRVVRDTLVVLEAVRILDRALN